MISQKDASRALFWKKPRMTPSTALRVRSKRTILKGLRRTILLLVRFIGQNGTAIKRYFRFSIGIDKKFTLDIIETTRATVLFRKTGVSIVFERRNKEGKKELIAFFDKNGRKRGVIPRRRTRFCSVRGWNAISKRVSQSCQSDPARILDLRRLRADLHSRRACVPNLRSAC